MAIDLTATDRAALRYIVGNPQSQARDVPKGYRASLRRLELAGCIAWGEATGWSPTATGKAVAL